MTRIFFEIARRARVEAVGVAMPGARLPERVRRIVDGGVAAQISRGRVALLAAACVVMCGAFFVGNVAGARQDEGQSGAAAGSGERPKFEVASVKPCEAGGGRGWGGSPLPQWSPGKITVTCQPVRFFIALAYIGHPDGESRPDESAQSIFLDLSSLNAPIEGLPAWGRSERFTIGVEAPGDASAVMMLGPIMQSVLEDRFKLRAHVETREVPVYNLVVAKGGPKMPQADDAVCRRPDPDHPGQWIGPANLPNCTLLFKRVSMADFAKNLRSPIGVDRPVIDKTGLTGTFAIRMAYLPGNLPADVNLPGDNSGLPTIFEAMKDQLGLELVAAKGPDKVLVIDHIEEPTAN